MTTFCFDMTISALRNRDGTGFKSQLNIKYLEFCNINIPTYEHTYVAEHS